MRLSLTPRQVWAAVGALAVLVVAVFAGRAALTTPSYTVTAQFASTPGLYAHNKVSILGVPSGDVVAIKAHASYIEVTMKLPQSVRIPATARAILMAPNPISDRTVELFPAYTGGPSLHDGSVIGLSKTVVPQGVDVVIKQVDGLAKALGPAGANRDGALSSAVGTIAKLVDGRGQDVHDLLTSLSTALPALTGTPDQLSRLISSLDHLTGILAAHDDAINAVFTHLTRATATIAADRASLGSAVANLESGLVAVTDFLRQNRQNLTSLTSRVASVSSSLVADQQALIKTFSGAAAGFDGFNRMIDVNARCVDSTKSACPVAFGRLISPIGVEPFVNQYCPAAIQSGLPVLVHSIPGLGAIMGLNRLDTATTLDSFCIAQRAISQGHNGTPGAPHVPNLDLQRFLR